MEKNTETTVEGLGMWVEVEEFELGCHNMGV